MNKQTHTSHTEDEQLRTELQQAFRVAHLPDETREQTRAFLSEYAAMRPIRAPHTTNTDTTRGWVIHAMQVTILRIRPVPALAALLVFFVSGSTALAAEGALPGDVLYPVKVSVNEQVRSALALSTEAQGTWEVTRAERRLEEATRLAATDSLDADTWTEIETRLQAHATAAETAAATLVQAEDIAGASEIESRLAATLAVHGEALRSIQNRTTDRDTQAQVAVALHRLENSARGTLAVATTPVTEEDGADAAVMSTMSLQGTPEESADANARAVSFAESADAATATTEAAPPAVSERTLERLRAAAEARIESAEQARERVVVSTQSRTQREFEASLATAHTAYAEGEAALEASNTGIAAEHFKTALRAAITAETTLRVRLRLDRFNIQFYDSAEDPAVDAEPETLPAPDEPRTLPADSLEPVEEPTDRSETDTTKPEDATQADTDPGELEVGSAVNVRIR